MARAGMARLRLRPSEASDEHAPGRDLDQRLLSAGVPGPNRRRARPRGGEIPAMSAVIEATAPAIEIDRLRLGYGGTPVLEDVTLTVRADEVFGLLGMNGAGKTTLLKAILMLAAPQAGTIRMFGEPHHLARARARLAYLPERFQPPAHLSGHEFVRLTLAFHGRAAKRTAIAALAEQLELDPSALREPIRQYGKGAAQRLGLLPLLLSDLPLLVLDEPMSGLEPKARLLVKRHLAAYRARGRTILLSSPIAGDHDQLCDRIAILHQGRLRYAGSPGALQARYGAPTLESAFLAAIEEPRRRAGLPP
jgi:ABC-2 type transport system ATP-binding protein